MSARIVYTDLDGTMVGPRGSFWHAAGRELTASPATALAELHRAGVPLVLVSGRTYRQLIEVARFVAADGVIAELGSLVGWARGETHLLPGERCCAAGSIPSRSTRGWPSRGSAG